MKLAQPQIPPKKRIVPARAWRKGGLGGIPPRLRQRRTGDQIKNCEENFFAGWRGFRATAGLASLLGVLLKKSSNINQKTPH